MLVSKDPFSFRDRQAAAKARDRFTEGSVFEVTTPTFDAKARADFNGCPVKPVVLLQGPTTIKPVPPTNTAMLEHPATGVEVCMDMSLLLQFLKDLGSAKSLNKTFDFCRKFLGISDLKTIEKQGGAPRCVRGQVC